MINSDLAYFEVFLFANSQSKVISNKQSKATRKEIISISYLHGSY